MTMCDCEIVALVNRLEDAEGLFNRLLATRNDLGLLPRNMTPSPAWLCDCPYRPGLDKCFG